MAKKHLITLSVIAILLTTSIGAAPVHADSGGRVPQADISGSYSDRDIVEFFLFASGPAAKAHPEILRNLGSEPGPEPEAATLDAITRALAKTDGDFTHRVTQDVQSQDPYKAESAVKRLASDVRALQKSDTANKIDPRAARGNNSTQVFPYTTVAVSVVVAVTVLAVASVAGIFLALYENPVDSSDLRGQDLAASLATSF